MSCVWFTPVSFPLSGKEKRLAVGCISIPRGSGSPLVRSHDFVRLSGLSGSLRACAFLCGDPDGVRRDAGNGVGGAAFVRFCVTTLALKCFPRGERWGCAPQTCAKESSTLWTLFTLRRGYAGAYSPHLCAFAQPYWLCSAFRGEYAGAARPRLRQRVFDSLDSLHAAAGLGWCVFAAPSPGYTERPARL